MVRKKGELYIDPIIKPELDRIKHIVTKRDRDFVIVFDGEEGSGKSVLAMQVMKYLDPTFCLDDVVFNSDQFLKRIKVNPKFKALLLDETYTSASSRGALSEVNRAMVGIATEMRQQNQFVGMCLPSIFDLDKYFALWRCRCLFHTYFNKKDGSRSRYVIFPQSSKKLLYLNGKKFYNYSKPRSPFPVCRFNNFYVVDEMTYRLRKSQAFQKRPSSNQAKGWVGQRNALIKELYYVHKVNAYKIAKIFEEREAKPLVRPEITKIINELRGR